MGEYKGLAWRIRKTAGVYYIELFKRAEADGRETANTVNRRGRRKTALRLTRSSTEQRANQGRDTTK
jgi:hypothetical protein